MKIKFHSMLNLLVVLCMVLAMLPITGAAAQVDQPDPKTSRFNLLDNTTEIIGKIDPEIRDLLLTKSDGEIKVSVLVKPGTDLSAWMGKHVVVKTTPEFDRVVGFVPVQNVVRVAAQKGTLVVLNMDERPAPDVLRPVGLDGELQAVKTPEKAILDRAVLDAAKANKPYAEVKRVEGFSLAADRYPVEEKSVPTGGTKDYFTNDYNGVYTAWDLFGVTGDGDPNDPLKVAVIDSGVDFANNDLLNTKARITDPNSAYFDAGLGIGWPIAFDDRSMSDYLLGNTDRYSAPGWGTYGWYMSTEAEGLIVDPDLLSTDEFCFTVDVPATFQGWYSWDATQDYCVSPEVQSLPGNSGNYRFGWHPDDSLTDWYGQPIGALVLGFDYGADWGPYNAVIVDMETDWGTDFTFGYQDPLARLGSEELGVFDYWSADPGYNDHSGGMVYFIADGTHAIPASDWVYGMSAPEAGTIVAFMINDMYEGGGDHGQLCAGTVIGQGQIYKTPYAGTFGNYGWPPAWYSGWSYGGINQGPALDSKLVAMGNYYQGGSTLNFYDFTALGYDGIPAGEVGDTHDQPHINSNSYGSGAVENDGWDFGSRYMSLISRGYVAQQGIELPDDGAHSSLFVKSAGNSGFGYGTINTPGSETGVMAGASGVFGQFNFGDTAHSSGEVNYGDLTGMSDRGPSAMGNGGVTVLTNGMFGSGNLPVNEMYLYVFYYGAAYSEPAGDTALDSWAGTSRSGPEAMGILALIYDAYFDRFGEYPTWEQARTLLMNGATHTYNDPFAQGAGLANAANSIALIKGPLLNGVEQNLLLFGAVVENEDGDGFWNVGNYRGEEYPGYTMGLFPGEEDTETFTLTNNSFVPKFFTAEAVTMELIDARDWNFTSLPLSGTGSAGEGGGARYYERRLYGYPADTVGNFGGVPPLYDKQNGYDNSVLQQADLMVVRMSYPWDQYENYEAGNWWFLYVWAWHDTTTSAPIGQWYTDVNTNTVRNGTGGEYLSYGGNELVRMNYDYHGNVAEVRIREPYQRLMGGYLDDGVFGNTYSSSMTDMIISLRHFYYGGYDTTDLKVTVELYQEVPWTDTIEVESGAILPELPVKANNLISVLPMGSTGVDVTAYAEDHDYFYSMFFEPFDDWGYIDWYSRSITGMSAQWLTTQTMDNPNGQTYENWVARFNSHAAYPGDSALMIYRSSISLYDMCSPQMGFYMYHDPGYPSQMDSIQVQVAVVDPDILKLDDAAKASLPWENVGDPIYRYAADAGWTYHSLDLSAYTNQYIAIGFLGTSAMGNNIFIDNVQINASYCKDPGAYTGYLKVEETDQYGQPVGYHTQYVPITMNVLFSADQPVTLGWDNIIKSPYPDFGLYRNDTVYGATGTDEAQRAESGDWRFFYTDIAEVPAPGTFLLAQTTWMPDGTADAATDIDTLIYGPVAHNGFFSDVPELETLFGPSGLEVIGGSARVGSAPGWDYYTTTGGPEDWSAVQVENAGLHAVAAQVTRWGGEYTALPFTIDLGTANVTPELKVAVCDYSAAPSGTVSFTTNHPGLSGDALEAVTYGFTVPVDEDIEIEAYEDIFYPYELVATDTYRLSFNTSLPLPGYDLDLTVYYSPTGSAPWTAVGSSAGSDSEEEVVLMYPGVGYYLVDVFGYAVPATELFNLKIEEVSGLGALILTDVPTNILLGEMYDIGVTFDPAFVPVERGTYMGYIFLGPEGSPYMIEIPVKFVSDFCFLLPLITLLP